MSLQRKLIRHKVADILSEPVISNIKKVFSNRQARVSADEVPCVIVYTKSEKSEIGIQAPRQYTNTLALVVLIQVLHNDNPLVDDLLDEISEEVRQRLFKNETLDGLAADLKLADTEIDFITDSEAEIGACRMTFDVTYWDDAPKEVSGLDDFLRYHAEYPIVGSTPETVPIEDDSEVPQT